MKILIVEDELIVAWNLKLTFERMGHEVLKTAMTADEAVRAARADDPDLILMDVLLKGPATGIDAAREIRSFSDASIAYITGNEHLLSDEQIQATRPLGVYSKPTSDGVLRSIADSAVAIGGRRSGGIRRD